MIIENKNPTPTPLWSTTAISHYQRKYLSIEIKLRIFLEFSLEEKNILIGIWMMGKKIRQKEAMKIKLKKIDMIKKLELSLLNCVFVL